VKTLYSAKLVINDNLRKEATIHFKFPKSFAECVDFEITGQSQLPIHIIQDVQNHCLDDGEDKQCPNNKVHLQNNKQNI
jgi:hypothetical protein